MSKYFVVIFIRAVLFLRLAGEQNIYSSSKKNFMPIISKLRASGKSD